MTDKTTSSDKPAPPRFVGGPERSRIVTLNYPLEYDGKLWTEITVRRTTVGDLMKAVAAMNDDPEKRLRLPMFDAPDIVMDNLDTDDDDRIQEVVNDFLPRRFRGLKEPEPLL